MAHITHTDAGRDYGANLSTPWRIEENLASEEEILLFIHAQREIYRPYRYSCSTSKVFTVLERYVWGKASYASKAKGEFGISRCMREGSVIISIRTRAGSRQAPEPYHTRVWRGGGGGQ